MIHRVTSSLRTFKSLAFSPGLNVIVADKSEGASDRQTRNSSGKTSLIAIIHHLLGANCNKDSIFKSESLDEHSFEMALDLSGQRVTVARRGSDANRIVVNANLHEWSEQPRLDSSTGETVFSLKQWNAALGASVFGIDENEKYAPTFRSCIPYFARREWDGGFDRPENAFHGMNAWNQQVNLSFLLGLDWENPQKLQHLRDQESTLKLLKKDSGKGVLGKLVGRSGELTTRLAVAETELAALNEQLVGFEVLPEYRELEKEASLLAVQLSDASNQNALDREQIRNLESQIDAEQPGTSGDVIAMYEEANIVFSELVTQRLESVEQFHRRIVENRMAHLQSEITSALGRIEERERISQQRDQRRIEIMNTLSSRGAIDQLQRLEEERSRLSAEVEDLRRRLETAERIEETKTTLTIERAQVQKATQVDHREHGQLIREAVVLFELFSKAISDHEGSLTIDVGTNGPTFGVDVEGGRSVGIRNMQIFCFDMMLSVLWAKRNSGPGFLVHDSHLFDGVDSRQVAAAIQMGAVQAAKHGFQYIITMNSDTIPRHEFSTEFDFDSFVNPVRLSDATETGGLFGMRI